MHSLLLSCTSCCNRHLSSIDRWLHVSKMLVSIAFKCAFISLFPIHCPNVPLVLCTQYSQRVSCCLVPCLEYVSLLKVIVEVSLLQRCPHYIITVCVYLVFNRYEGYPQIGGHLILAVILSFVQWCWCP